VEVCSGPYKFVDILNIYYVSRMLILVSAIYCAIYGAMVIFM